VAGYLTHVMVLIKAEAWLGELITAMERRQQAHNGCLVTSSVAGPGSP
jgi:hypothetical protein